MAALDTNPELIFSAFLRLARKQADPTAWLEALQAAALTNSSSTVSVVLEKMQDSYAGSVSHAATATTWLRELSCIVIAQLCEAALQKLEAEDAAEEAGTLTVEHGAVRYPDFSKHPSILG